MGEAGSVEGIRSQVHPQRGWDPFQLPGCKQLSLPLTPASPQAGADGAKHQGWTPPGLEPRNPFLLYCFILDIRHSNRTLTNTARTHPEREISINLV